MGKKKKLHKNKSNNPFSDNDNQNRLISPEVTSSASSNELSIRSFDQSTQENAAKSLAQARQEYVIMLVTQFIFSCILSTGFQRWSLVQMLHSFMLFLTEQYLPSYLQRTTIETSNENSFEIKLGDIFFLSMMIVFTSFIKTIFFSSFSKTISNLLTRLFNQLKSNNSSTTDIVQEEESFHTFLFLSLSLFSIVDAGLGLLLIYRNPREYPQILIPLIPTMSTTLKIIYAVFPQMQSTARYANNFTVLQTFYRNNKLPIKVMLWPTNWKNQYFFSINLNELHSFDQKIQIGNKPFSLQNIWKVMPLLLEEFGATNILFKNQVIIFHLKKSLSVETLENTFLAWSKELFETEKTMMIILNNFTSSLRSTDFARWQIHYDFSIKNHAIQCNVTFISTLHNLNPRKADLFVTELSAFLAPNDVTYNRRSSSMVVKYSPTLTQVNLHVVALNIENEWKKINTAPQHQQMLPPVQPSSTTPSQPQRSVNLSAWITPRQWANQLLTWLKPTRPTAPPQNIIQPVTYVLFEDVTIGNTDPRLHSFRKNENAHLRVYFDEVFIGDQLLNAKRQDLLKDFRNVLKALIFCTKGPGVRRIKGTPISASQTVNEGTHDVSLTHELKIFGDKGRVFLYQKGPVFVGAFFSKVALHDRDKPSHITIPPLIINNSPVPYI